MTRAPSPFSCPGINCRKPAEKQGSGANLQHDHRAQSNGASSFVRHSVSIRTDTLTGMQGFETAAKNHEGSAPEQVVIEFVSEQLKITFENCRRLAKDIKAVARTVPAYDCIISIKGIGPLSLALFLSAIGDMERFAKPGNLAACFGITPRVSESNAKRHVGRIARRGDKLARIMHVQCTLIAGKYSPHLREVFERIKARRDSGEAIIATARRFLNEIFSTLKYGRVFEDFANFKKTGSCIQS